jgi:hypothetical protein
VNQELSWESLGLSKILRNLWFVRLHNFWRIPTYSATVHQYSIWNPGAITSIYFSNLKFWSSFYWLRFSVWFTFSIVTNCNVSREESCMYFTSHLLNSVISYVMEECFDFICDKEVFLKTKENFITWHYKIVILYRTGCWAVQGQQENKFNFVERIMLRWVSCCTKKIESKVTILRKMLRPNLH